MPASHVLRVFPVVRGRSRAPASTQLGLTAGRLRAGSRRSRQSRRPCAPVSKPLPRLQQSKVWCLAAGVTAAAGPRSQRKRRRCAWRDGDDGELAAANGRALGVRLCFGRYWRCCRHRRWAAAWFVCARGCFPCGRAVSACAQPIDRCPRRTRLTLACPCGCAARGCMRANRYVESTNAICSARALSWHGPLLSNNLAQ